MNTTKQSGFGVVAIVIAVLVVVGLSYVGYRVYTANNNQTGNTTQNSNTQSNGTQDTAKYLDIKELGIKIKLDDSIKDAVYRAHTNTDGSQYADISTQSLTDKSNASCGLGGVPMATVTKISTSSRNLTPDNTRTFKLGDNYFIVAGAGSTCSNDQTVQNLASQQKTTFLQNFKTVQLDN